MYLRLALIISLAIAATDASAQFWKKKKKRARAEMEVTVQEPTSLNPSASRRKYVPKEAHKAVKGPTYGLQEEFYERMEKLAKERRKEARIMRKPQYSNPMYFGHKHPPKKHKPSKMKYCKVCGIRH